MPLYTVTVRFDSGTEYWSTERLPAVGETIVRAERRYLVTHVDADDEHAVVVTVSEASAEPVAAANAVAGVVTAT